MINRSIAILYLIKELRIQQEYLNHAKELYKRYNNYPQPRTHLKNICKYLTRTDFQCQQIYDILTPAITSPDQPDWSILLDKINEII